MKPSAAAGPAARRDLRVDTMRGLACLLLVAYHTIGDDPARGLHAAGDALRWLADSFAYLRMPLFTFLSGYVYAMRPARRGDLAPFLRGKARRLLLPLVCVGLIHHFVQAATTGANAHPDGDWLFLLYPYEHYWYLQALFLIFLFMYAVEAAGLGARLPALWALAAGSLLLAPWVQVAGDPFSVENAAFLLPYFLLGVLLRRSPLLADPARLPRGFAAAAGLAVLAFAAWQQAGMAGWPVPPLSPDRLPGQIYSALCVALLYALAWSWRPLARVGGHSYAIYLYHVFGTAGSRIALGRLGVQHTGVLFAAGMLAGVLLPVALERVLDRWPATRACLLGKAWRDPGGAP